MNGEELDDLLKVPASTRADAEAILFALETRPDGLNATTESLAADVLGYSDEEDFNRLFDLDFALRALAENHGLLLDGRHHDGLPEGLPFHLDFYVWHRSDATANGMFVDSGRDYHDEFEGMIAREIGKILERALPVEVVPQSLEYSRWNDPACDAELLGIGCSFAIGEFDFELGFELNTGRGGLMRADDPLPEPYSYSISLRCEGTDESGEDVCYLWDSASSEWSRCEED